MSNKFLAQRGGHITVRTSLVLLAATIAAAVIAPYRYSSAPVSPTRIATRGTELAGAPYSFQSQNVRPT